MAWAVDTCVLVDVVLADPVFKHRSATLLNQRRGDGLVICPAVFVELAPALAGDLADAELFLQTVGVGYDEPWLPADTYEAFATWNRCVVRRRQNRTPRRLLPDVLIGAFASRFDGLLTRNPSDFRSVFPNLTILEP